MISIHQAVAAFCKDKPFFEEALSQNILNLSSVARYIQTDIEAYTQKSVKTGAIVMALKRLSASKAVKPDTTIDSAMRDITVRSGLAEYTFRSSPTILSAYNRLFRVFRSKPDIVCSISLGLMETTMIVSRRMEPTIRRVFQNETQEVCIPHLAALIIRLSKDTTEMPGMYYMILKYLAWDNINVIEIISTYTELTIIVREDDIDRAFSSIKRRGIQHT